MVRSVSIVAIGIALALIVNTVDAQQQGRQQRGSNSMLPVGFEYLLEYETRDLAILVTEEGDMLLKSQGVSDPTALTRNQLLQLALTLEMAKVDAAMNKKVAETSGGRGVATVEVVYCVACGYKDKFDYFVNRLHSMAPRAQIKGSNKLPSKSMQLIGWLCGYGMMYAAAIVAIASFVFPDHRIAQQIVENKIQVFLGGYVLMMLGGQFMSTGAFEVYVNGNLYFNKGANGAFPDLDALARSTAQYIAAL